MNVIDYIIIGIVAIIVIAVIMFMKKRKPTCHGECSKCNKCIYKDKLDDKNK